jgi:acetoin utilization deacetylase AcuC-like enzyme
MNIMVKKKVIGLIYHPDFLLHNQNYHPEKKERLEAIINLLHHEKLLTKLQLITPKVAKVKEVRTIHTANYIKSLRNMVKQGKAYLDADTYLTPYSYQVALLSVGGAITAMRMVMKETLKVAYVINRPPGHHASANRGMGFCLFNNGAIAAKLALTEFNIKRLLYIDWDVHHGNGIQQAFYHDPRVLYISLHENPAFPGTGAIEETGAGLGKGYNINIPLPPRCGDKEYQKAFTNIIMPAADIYRPELIMVSAGYDIYHQDPLGHMQVTYHGLATMTSFVKKIANQHCQGKIVLFLEGGYHLQGQAEAVTTTLSVLGNWRRPIKEEIIISSSSIKSEASQIINRIRRQSLPLLLKASDTIYRN